MALLKTLYLDFETQSKLSLKKAGAYRYAEHPSTDVMCAGWAVVDHTSVNIAAPYTVLWTRKGAETAGIDLLAEQYAHKELFITLAADPGVRLVAHNIEFERQILREKYGVDVPLSRCSCTAARAARMSLPRSLEKICIALGLDEEKDKDGHKVLMKLTRSRRPSKEDQSEFWTEQKKPVDYLSVFNYCLQDVRAMMAVDLQLPELDATEREIWETTIEMNERGVRPDMPAVRHGIALAELEKSRIALYFEELFGCGPGSPKAATALGMPDLQKSTVRDALKRTDLTERQREGLLLRQRYARTSVDKLKAFASRVQKDGKVRGSLTYSGAERTQRWSGSGVQPQNFPRGMGKKTDAAFAALHAGALDIIYPDVLKTLSEMLRGFILGPLLVGDYSQVEARVLAWLAQEESLLQLFRSGGDPYCELASEVYGRKITKADEKERFMGKQAVLGSGYQIGPDKFRGMLDALHDVQVSDEFAKRVVFTYRRKYSRIVAFWARMERAFLFTVREKARRIRASNSSAPPIFMGTLEVHGRPFAYIELPSGRCLYYAYPETCDKDSYGDNAQVQYLGRSPYTHQWSYISTYGGKLTENIVQALSRDLLADAMLRLRAAGFPLVLTVHDEVVADDRTVMLSDVDAPAADTLHDFTAEMNRVPAWAEGLPLAAECFRCGRYRK